VSSRGCSMVNRLLALLSRHPALQWMGLGCAVALRRLFVPKDGVSDVDNYSQLPVNPALTNPVTMCGDRRVSCHNSSLR
jgi:hypothetical protein